MSKLQSIKSQIEALKPNDKAELRAFLNVHFTIDGHDDRRTYSLPQWLKDFKMR